MADYDAQPVNAGTSKGFGFSSQSRVAAPFTESNMTWVEVENSTAADWAGFTITLNANNAAWAYSGIFFVAKGAASSEVRLATVPVTSGYRMSSITMYVPVPIPAGTRLSVSSSSATAQTLSGQLVGVLSANFDAEPAFTVYESGPYDLSASTAYGKWVDVDPGGTANTKGSYTEISYTGHTNNVLNGDSLANAYDYFGFMVNGNFNTAQRPADFLLDFATGAATSEVIYGADINQVSTSGERSTQLNPIEVPTLVAISTARISVRAQSSTTDAIDRIRGVLLFGVR